MGYYALDYNFSIKYNSTNTIGYADALSRLMTTQNKVQEDSVITVLSLHWEVTSVLASTVRALSLTSTIICEATASDPVLQKVICFHKWPEVCTDKRIQSFFHCWSSLLSNAWLSYLHYMTEWSSNFIMVIKVLAVWNPLAYSYVYLPNMDKQLEELVRTFSICRLAARSSRKTTLSFWPVPESPSAFTLILVDPSSSSIILSSLMLTANGQNFFRWIASPWMKQFLG